MERLFAARWLTAALLAGSSVGANAAPDPVTICTITINSSDEREALRRHLPDDQYRFVELVERGRADWLRSACRAQIQCDLLVVSAHFDGGNQFFADRPDTDEYLTVEELERVSCSEACPSLFSMLTEVYLFGCNTLNPAPQSRTTAEIVRTLVRGGHTREQAERELRSLTAVHDESSRDRMRLTFKDVPLIYGFSSTAPIGPVAGRALDRYLRAGGTRDIGSGRVSSRLQNAFAPFSFAVAAGVSERDPDFGARADMCQFADERRSAATRLRFVHALMQRHIAEIRLHLDRVQRLMDSLDVDARRVPEVAQQLDVIAKDQASRDRVLAYARATESMDMRVRLLDLARDLGWLNTNGYRGELAVLLVELQSRPEVGVGEVDLACRLNADRSLDGALARDRVAEGMGHAALRACLGSEVDRTHVLQALSMPNEDHLRIVQSYLRHRPLANGPELWRATSEVAAMEPGDAQVLALEVIGRHHVSDGQVLNRLILLFSTTTSTSVQSAVAGVLVRADRRGIEASSLARTLLEHRRPATDGSDRMVELLLELLQPR